MGHFSQDIVGKPVVDVHGVDIGTITGIEDGYARLKDEASVASQMEEAPSPSDVEGIAIEPKQVVEVVDDYVRVNVEHQGESS